MTQISVKSRANQAGQQVPFSFIWDGTSYQVEDVGRRWEENDGEHILVRVETNNRVFELRLEKEIDTWWMVKEHLSPNRQNV